MATALAKTDPSAEVVVNIIDGLSFRRADRHVADILRTASEAVWERMIRKGYPRNLSDDALNTRLADMRRATIAQESDPIRAIVLWAEQEQSGSEGGAQIEKLILSTDFNARNEHATAALQRVFAVYPEQTARALVGRISAGLEIPYRSGEFLREVPAVDEGPVAAVVLDEKTPKDVRVAALALVGPKTVVALWDRLFEMDIDLQQNGKLWGNGERERYHGLKDSIVASRGTSFFAALLERADSTQLERICLMAEVLARRGAIDDTAVIVVDRDNRARLVAAAQRWIEVVLNSPGSARRSTFDVVRAAGALGDSKLVNSLHQLLERHLTDYAHEREMQARRLVDIPISFSLQFRRAFSTIGGAEVIALMMTYLPDRRFGLEAASTLADIWNRQHPSGREKRFGVWRDFSEVKSRQKLREDPHHPLPTCEFAEAIFDVVRDITVRDDDAAQRHAIALATIALSLPHGSKRQEIDRLLALLQPLVTKQRLMAAAAAAGEVISADVLLAGVRELLDAAKKEPWRLDEQRGELMGWIELFAFSDRPTTVLTALDLLPAQHRDRWKLSRLLTALGQSPQSGALAVLLVLAERNPRAMQQYEWLNALVEIGTEAAARVLLEYIGDGRLVLGAGGVDAHKLSQELARFGRHFSAVRQEMARRYEELPMEQPKAIIESALAENPDPPSVLTLIRHYAADNRPFDGRLHQAIRDIAIGKRPVDDWPGAYEQFSVPLTKLRRKLFEMTLSLDSRSILAEDCLTVIDELRDQNGRIDEEPRHPDIASGRPWPKEAAGVAR